MGYGVSLIHLIITTHNLQDPDLHKATWAAARVVRVHKGCGTGELDFLAGRMPPELEAAFVGPGKPVLQRELGIYGKPALPTAPTSSLFSVHPEALFRSCPSDPEQSYVDIWEQ